MFLADRYGRLARYHSGRGNIGRAQRFDELAAWHFKQGNPTPPIAVAAAMPIPSAPVLIQAVSPYPSGPDNAA